MDLLSPDLLEKDTQAMTCLSFYQSCCVSIAWWKEDVITLLDEDVDEHLMGCVACVILG